MFISVLVTCKFNRICPFPLRFKVYRHTICSRCSYLFDILSKYDEISIFTPNNDNLDFLFFLMTGKSGLLSILLNFHKKPLFCFIDFVLVNFAFLLNT